MKTIDIRMFIATDKYNLLRDGENRVFYAIKKAYYRFLGFHKKEVKL